MGLVPGNPGVLPSDSRAKYAVAFFKMSRSIVTRASCARSGSKKADGLDLARFVFGDELLDGDVDLNRTL
jgi:hypothetical protein